MWKQQISFAILLAISWFGIFKACNAKLFENNNNEAATNNGVITKTRQSGLRSSPQTTSLIHMEVRGLKKNKEKTSNPTSSPTSSPTTNPTTASPTITPIVFPTTTSPSLYPTAMPVEDNNDRPPTTNKPTSAPVTSAPVTNKPTITPTMEPTDIIIVPLQKFVVVLVTSNSNISIEPSAVLEQTEQYFNKELPNVLRTDLKLNRRRNLAEDSTTFSISGSALYSSSVEKVPSMTELWKDQNESLKSPNYLESLRNNINPNIVESNTYTTDYTPPPTPPPTPTPSIENQNNNPNGNTSDPNNVNSDEGSSSNIPLIGGIVGGLAAVFTVGAYGFVRYRRHKGYTKNNNNGNGTSLYDADGKDKKFVNNEDPSVMTPSVMTGDNTTFNPRSSTASSIGFQRTGESVRSDAFSLDGEENFSPNQGQIMLNNVMAMSSYSAEQGDKFIWSTTAEDDNNGNVNYKRMVFQRAASSSCSSADDSADESDDGLDDNGTAFSYSKACAQSVISHGSHTNTISPSLFSPSSLFPALNEENEDGDSIFDGIEVVMSENQGILNVSYDTIPSIGADSILPTVDETEKEIANDNVKRDTIEQQPDHQQPQQKEQYPLDTSHDIPSPFVSSITEEEPTIEKNILPVLDKKEKITSDLEEDEESTQSLHRISVVENNPTVNDYRPKSFMNQLEQIVLEEDSEKAKKKKFYPFRSKSKKGTFNDQSLNGEKGYDYDVEPIVVSSKRDYSSNNNGNGVDKISRPLQPLDETELNDNSMSSSRRNLRNPSPHESSSSNNTSLNSPPKPPVYNTSRRTLLRDSSRYRSERIGGSRNSRTPSRGRPELDEYDDGHLDRMKTPERRRPTQLQTLSPTAGAASSRRNRLARRKEIEDEEKDQNRIRGASVSAAELRRNRLAKQAALSNSSSFRNHSHHRHKL